MKPNCIEILFNWMYPEEEEEEESLFPIESYSFTHATYIVPIHATGQLVSFWM